MYDSQGNYALGISLISEFVSIRKIREGIIGEFIKCEYNTETMEGMAEYCGTMALKQLNINKYNSRMEHYLKVIKKYDDVFFDTRRISYYVGAVLIVALKDTVISFYHNAGKTQKTIFDIISEKMQLNYKIEIGSICPVEHEVDKYIKGKRAKFQEFFALKTY